MTGLNINKKWYLLFGLLCLGYLWFFPYFDHLNNPNENVRLYQTRAMVEDSTFSIGQSVLTQRGTKQVARATGGVIAEWGWVNDKAVVCTDGATGPPCNGTLYPAKAPGLSFLAIPPYWAARTVIRLIADRDPTKMEYIWATRTACVLIPSLFFLIFFRRRMVSLLTDKRDCMAGVEPHSSSPLPSPPLPPPSSSSSCPCRQYQSTQAAATMGTIALATGTMAFPYALLLTGHYLSALAIGTAFLLFYGSKNNPRHRTITLTLGGLLLGITPSLEYPATVPAMIAGLYLLVAYRRQPRLLVAPVMAALVPIALLAWYQHAVFGSPLSTPYDHLENVSFIRDMSPGLYGIHLPALKPLLGSLFSAEAGLFFFSPWLLLTIPGFILMIFYRRGTRARTSTSSPAITAVPTSSEPPNKTKIVGQHWLEALFLLAICLSMILMLAAMPNWRIMLGWTAGPRYMAPMTTAAAIAACVAIAHIKSLPMRVIAGFLIAMSAAMTIPGAILYPHYPMEFSNPVFQLAYPLMAEGYFPRNMGLLLHMPAGWPAAIPGLLALLIPLVVAIFDYCRTSTFTREAALTAGTSQTAEGHIVQPATMETSGRTRRQRQNSSRGTIGTMVALIMTMGILYVAIPDEAITHPAPIVRQGAWVRRHWEPTPTPPADPCQLIDFRMKRAEKKEVTRLIRQYPQCGNHQ